MDFQPPSLVPAYLRGMRLRARPCSTGRTPSRADQFRVILDRARNLLWQEPSRGKGGRAVKALEGVALGAVLVPGGDPVVGKYDQAYTRALAIALDKPAAK